MVKHRIVWVLVAAALIGGVWMAQALAQEGDRPERRRRDDQDRRQRMERFRQRMQERMRERLGATEAEWKVLWPRMEKVQQLQRQTRGGFGFTRGRFDRRDRRGRGDREGDAAQREQSEVEKKTEALRNLLEDEASGAGAIKAALEALRKARAAAAQELAAARKELRAVVTVRQEAQLVLMGLLD